jgi:hypothetical protein
MSNLFKALRHTFKHGLLLSLVSCFSISLVLTLGLGTAGNAQILRGVRHGSMMAGTQLIARGNGQMQVSYLPTRNPLYRELTKVYQQTQVYEKMADLIDNRIGLPRNVSVQVAECGFINAFYEPGKHRIVMCHELTEYFIKLFRQIGADDRRAGEQALYASVFTFFHESGHMLINELDLPITGREEDAADQFSAVLLSRSGPAGDNAILAAAQWFSASNKTASRMQFMDEHSLDQQRFYYLICLLYGEDPRSYAGLAQKVGFPRDRQQKCVAEYAKISKSWRALLAPHMKR